MSQPAPASPRQLSNAATSLPAPAPRSERVLLQASAEEPGPGLLVIGSLHGNEPSGHQAARRVDAIFSAVQADGGQALRRGDVLGLAGNLTAIHRGVRFIDHDLNRGWSTERLARLEENGPESIEDREMLDLFHLIQEFRSQSRGDLSFLDLHSTSGDSPPFASVANREADRRLVQAIPVPTVFGIDQHLEGTFLECMQHFNFSGVVFESGQHDDPVAIDHAEAALWLVLENLSLVDRELHPQIAERLDWSHSILEPIGARYPRMLLIEYRYALDSGANFTMHPGFESFQAISEGQLLAAHHQDEVRAHRDGRILMPLYQPLGDEGFFLMSELEA